MADPKKNQYSISAVEHALTVLEFIVKKQADVSAIEIHARTGIPKPTLHKLLQTLRQLGYIEQNEETNQYSATMKPLQIGYYCLNRRQFLSTFYPYVLMYLRRFRCAISLSVFSRNEVVVAYSAIGGASTVVDSNSIIGLTSSVYASSSGRVLLASLTDDAVRELLATVPLTPFTERTPHSVEEIILSLEQVRRTGFCRLDGERYYGFSTISFPIYDITERLVGTLDLAMPTTEIDSAMTDDTIAEIKQTLSRVQLNCN